MKVLIVSHLYPSSVNPANGVFVHEQVKELIKLGCEVTVVSPVKLAPFPLQYLSEKWEMYAQYPYRERYDGVDVYYPRYISLPKNILFDKTGYFMYKSIRSLVTRLHVQHSFDLIHAHVALPDGAAVNRISGKLKVPYVLTIHGQDLQKTIHMNDRCKSEIFNTIENAEELILVSNKLNHLKREHFPGLHTKTSIVYNGVNEYFLYEVQKKLCSPKKLYFQSSGPKLLSVSNLVKEKGLEYNIRAVKLLVKEFKDLRYLVVGGGYDQRRLELLVKDLQLENHIEFIGPKNHREIKNIMEECDVFSMPSFNESFGVVYIEAMACEKPVIGCFGQGIEDIVVNGESGFLVHPKSSGEIYDICTKLFKDEDYRNKIGYAARRVVEERFTWKKAASTIFDIYENVKE